MVEFLYPCGSLGAALGLEWGRDRVIVDKPHFRKTTGLGAARPGLKRYTPIGGVLLENLDHLQEKRIGWIKDLAAVGGTAGGMGPILPMPGIIINHHWYLFNRDGACRLAPLDNMRPGRLRRLVLDPTPDGCWARWRERLLGQQGTGVWYVDA